MSERQLGTRDLTYRDIRDMLWLARSLSPVQDPAAPPQESSKRPESLPPEDIRVDEPRDATSQEDQKSLANATEPLESLRKGLTDTVRHIQPAGIGRSDPSSETAPLGWPTVPALPGVRQISRALRPLMRTSESPWQQELDEEQTAQNRAQNGVWLPCWRPSPWHRFELVLVVDSARSTELWQRTIEEFRELLRRQGAFRDIRTYLVDCSHAKDEDLLLRPEGPAGTARNWNDLIDPSGRRMILILTDAISVAWRNGAAERMVARWAWRMPVAILNVLPQRLWRWGALAPCRVRLSAPEPGVANSRIRVHAAGTPRRAGSVVVPVLNLSASWLSGWAKLVATPGAGNVETTAVFLSANSHEPSGPPPDQSESDVQLTASQRVLKFRTFASLQGFQLASLLAAAPLNLPTMRLVQRIMLPGSGMDALAEVFLGGLLRPASHSIRPHVATAVAYEFHDGVRETLLSGGRRSTTVQVARVLGRYAGPQIAVLSNLRDAVEDPDNTEFPEVNAENRPFIKVQEAVLRSLSGGYAKRSKRLRHDLGLPNYTDVISHHAETGQQLPHAKERTTATVSTTETQISAGNAETADTAGGEKMAIPDSLPQVASTRAPAGRPKIWKSVPLRNPDFVGREQLLEQLHQRLLSPGATAVLPEALHGMGGVGKSQTVVEYIYRHASEYDLIWWIAAEHRSQIITSLAELAKRLGIPTTGPAEDAVESVLEALRLGDPHSRWLLVFDNADRPEVIQSFFPAGPGHIIVTSRNAQWTRVARTVEVNLFTRLESIELLRRSGGEITDGDADQLAEALGDLPLAIEQAAAWRAQTGMPVDEYLQLLEQDLTELMGEEASSDYQRSVAAAWNVPLSRLRSEHPAALQMLQVCAFFGPEPISRSMFTGVRGAPVPEELASALSAPIKLNRAIGEISRYSLAKIDHRNNTLQLHRLVQTVLKSQLTESEREEMRHAVHVLLVHGDPGIPSDSTSWPRYADLLPHALVSKAIECTDEWVRGLMINLTSYLLSTGDYRGAMEASGQTLEAWRRLLGEDDNDTLMMARNHGAALWRLGRDKEAQALNADTYDRVRRIQGEESELYLFIADTVAADLRTSGDFLKELETRQNIYNRSCAIPGLGEDHPETLRYANNLAGSLRLTGNFPRARDVDEDNLRRRAVVLGEEHTATFYSRNALSMDLRECGQFSEACRIQEETLPRQRELFGDDHPSTIGAIRNLAVAKRKAGDHESALVLSKECHRRYQQRHGDQHVDTMTGLLTVSADLRHQPDLELSLTYATRSHVWFLANYPENHPFTLIAANNLAITLRLLGEAEEAKTLDESAYSAFLAAFGPDHPWALVSATNLASDLVDMGHFEQAREIDTEILERSTRVLSPLHPSTLAVSLNLSLDLKHLKHTEESAILHDNTVSNFRTALGEHHAATIAAARAIRANCETDTMQF